MIDLDEIARLARAATRGPWFLPRIQEDRDACFVAHMNPARALELVEQIRDLEKQVEGDKLAANEWKRLYYEETQKKVDNGLLEMDLKTCREIQAELRSERDSQVEELKRARELLDECKRCMRLARSRGKDNDWITGPLDFALAKLRSVSPQGAPAGGGEG